MDHDFGLKAASDHKSFGITSKLFVDDQCDGWGAHGLTDRQTDRQTDGQRYCHHVCMYISGVCVRLCVHMALALATGTKVGHAHTQTSVGVAIWSNVVRMDGQRSYSSVSALNIGLEKAWQSLESAQLIRTGCAWIKKTFPSIIKNEWSGYCMCRKSF